MINQKKRMSTRKCHLCGGETENKYCINETCAVYIQDEINSLEQSQECGWSSTTQREIDNLKKELIN